jgi:endoglycosylceramidase
VRRLASLVALLACLCAPALVQARPALPLKHTGRWIIDARGRVVIPHGFNMVYKRPPYAPDAIGFGDDDAKFLAREGYDSVRLGIIYKAVEPQPGVYDERYLRRIRRTVKILGRHGIVSLLDFHQDMFNERFQGEGWPEWSVLDDGLPAQPRLGFSQNYLAMPALQRAFDNFFANKRGPGGVGIEDRYARAWRHVAAGFAHNRNVMGYDLLNEPWPGAAWQDCVNPTGCPASDVKLAAFTRKTLAAIRRVDTRHLVFYEPWVLFNFGSGTTIGPFGDSKMVMSFHDYCLSAGANDSNEGCDNVDDMVFDHADQQAQRTRDGLLMTEFGATRAPDILTAMVQRADRHKVGWEEWHYCGCADPTTSGPGDKQALVIDPAKPPRGKNIDAGRLAILTRPHPEAVSGTPLSFGFDGAARVFTLTYSTRRASGHGSTRPGSLTEILVPRRVYRHGYVARVSGGRVRSRRNALTLLIAQRQGARTVRVVLRSR